jgi:uncharacterized protein (TIGR00288 family)
MDQAPRNLAVFIDFENCARAKHFELSVLMTRLKERGRLLIKRAYGDWGRFASDKKKLAKASVSLIELPSHGGRGKNSADIALVVDALEAIMNRAHIDTLVVVSGDSDYTPLYTKVRELGKRVIVIGPKDGTSDFVKDYCDELLFFRSLAGKPEADKAAARESYPLLIAAIRAIVDEGRVPKLSLLKTKMKQVDASFDESNYGISKFSKYLTRAERDGIIEIDRNGSNDWSIADADDNEPTLDDLDPEPARPIPPPKAAPAPAPIEQLRRALRKIKVPTLGQETQREVLTRILESASELEYPLHRKDFCEGILSSFAADLEAGTLSKSKIRGLLKTLELGGTFTADRIGEGEDACTEMSLAVPSDERAEQLVAHDRFLIAKAEELGLTLTLDDWTRLLISPAWPALVGA